MPDLGTFTKCKICMHSLGSNGDGESRGFICMDSMMASSEMSAASVA